MNRVRIATASAMIALAGVVSGLLSRQFSTATTFAAIFCFLLLSVFGLSKLSNLARGLFSIAAIVVPISIYNELIDVEELRPAIFVFGFILTTGLLREIAKVDPRLQIFHNRLGQANYPLVSLMVAFQALTLLVGALQFFVGILGQPNKKNKSALTSVALAGLAGFTLNPILSPMAIPFVVLSTILPNTSWLDLLPMLSVCALLVWCSGYIQNKTMQEDVQVNSVQDQGAESRMKPVTFVIVFIPLFGVLALNSLSSLTLAESALCTILAASLIWWCFNSHQSEVLKFGMTSSLNESVVIGTAVSIGVVFIQLLPDTQIEQLAILLANAGFAMPIIVLAGFVIFGWIGIPPSITFLAVLPILQIVTDLEPLYANVMFATTICGWSLSSVSSPMGIPILIVSKALKVSPFRLVFRLNLLFAVLSLASLGIMLGLFAFASS